MTLREMASLLDAEVCTGENRLEEKVEHAFASDLMSEVLTLGDTPVLITGLCNIQTIRTCEMAGLEAVIIVRDKQPSEDMIALVQENDMVIIRCRYSMFRACGILYSHGLLPLY